MTDHVPGIGCFMPVCGVCGKHKKPIGRSAPMETAGSYCDTDCPGYMEAPTPCHLWPGETEDA